MTAPRYVGCVCDGGTEPVGHRRIPCRWCGGSGSVTEEHLREIRAELESRDDAGPPYTPVAAA